MTSFILWEIRKQFFPLKGIEVRQAVLFKHLILIIQQSNLQIWSNEEDIISVHEWTNEDSSLNKQICSMRKRNILS